MIYSRFVASASSKSLSMSAATQSVTIPSWSDLKNRAGSMPVGIALNKEAELREMGKGSAFVQNKLRKFGSVDEPKITLFRDHAGWCPYCEKTMLLIEEKQVPVKIDLVPMRSYGDKPQEFLRKVPNGLLPAIEVNGQVVTESQVIMELLDHWHSEQDGYRPMLPREGDTAGWERYKKLARLERDLFGWWCTLLFRPEGGNPLTMLMASGRDSMSGAMQGFLDCMQKVDQELLSSNGPWFFDEHDYPTMIDFVYVSHVERMLASCAHWKGLDLRNPKWNLKGLNAWLEAFEKREPYLAFKSDYYTNVMDIPPQYGPGYDGGFNDDRKKFQASILGRDGKSWKLPLSFDDELQPLYRGMPLPSCVLDAAGLQPDSDGTYGSCDETTMSQACRAMAAWKLAGNGNNVSRFAARGGPQGAKNPRKRFGAELADPYAETDNEIRSATDSALRVVCAALMDVEATLPDQAMVDQLRSSVPDNQVEGVAAALAYLRDRVGVPRDLPLAAGRYFRAYLNWGIETLSK
jgi:glutathione S-transferase